MQSPAYDHQLLASPGCVHHHLSSAYVCRPAAPLRMWAVWYLGVAWALMQATAFAILFWTPILLDEIMSGRFDGGAAAPPAPHRSQREEVGIWPKTPIPCLHLCRGPSCSLMAPCARHNV